MCNIIAICFKTTNTQTYLPVKISGLQCSLLLKMNQLQVYVNVNLKVYFSWTTIDQWYINVRRVNIQLKQQTAGLKIVVGCQ